jgi:hypothetical protein
MIFATAFMWVEVLLGKCVTKLLAYSHDNGNKTTILPTTVQAFQIILEISICRNNNNFTLYKNILLF